MIRCYLRASTAEQDSGRARPLLEHFVRERGEKVAAWYQENASGSQAERPELRRLLDDANQGDAILVESIDRLARLPYGEWERLKGIMKSKGIRIVALDLPTSHSNLREPDGDDLTGRVLQAVNEMMVDLMAAMAYRDYQQRRERQMQGIQKARSEGKYRGRPKDNAKREKIIGLLTRSDYSIREIAAHVPCSTSTVQSIKADLKLARLEAQQ
ncbi:DNA invertase Pin-like site-specific DNA recombinase [Modicisalibacter xianhensis]|uniref:DNA invertase Pin-like site-specific DNA recombinase n=1 Tax=Modicisalibacter xianhensis TaxID=442341 RepID=A0A4R8FB66_9GAMM|nr:recombinase family protein [Halomonas xianhensis]TDX22960.1 DNA invertase Pin-like site-specific DNA recombinase [Halomonas xianhensis]